MPSSRQARAAVSFAPVRSGSIAIRHSPSVREMRPMSKPSQPAPLDKTIVVSGASAGIGAAFARLAGAQGARLVLAARRQPELAQVAREAGPAALAVVADVTHREQV